ncbi:hypothetical protein V6N12_019273 [Hibiscus sabdariffa]|uniref:Uncharacterized protein n=1 Tax=Hibiscus sabdariffa TaxID=183260 RepID=A0ABR2ASP5_9ROSI
MFESNEYSDDELAFESEYGDGQDGIHDMVFDFGRATENFTRKFNAHNVDDPIEGSSNASGEINETINDPNREAIKFYRLLQEVEQNLYPGCEDFSKLSFIVQILNFKYLYSVSAKAIDALLKILVKAFPKGNKLPSSFADSIHGEIMLNPLMEQKKDGVHLSNCMGMM